MAVCAAAGGKQRRSHCLGEEAAHPAWQGRACACPSRADPPALARWPLGGRAPTQSVTLPPLPLLLLLPDWQQVKAATDDLETSLSAV